MRAGHWVPIGVAVVILAVAGARVASSENDASQPRTEIAAPVPDDGTATPDWSGGAENAERHWRKHGSQFPRFSNEEEFVAGVHHFLAHPPPGTLTKRRRANGDTLYYDPNSGTFAVQAADGAPRTFFKPQDGMAYWERQH